MCTPVSPLPLGIGVGVGVGVGVGAGAGVAVGAGAGLGVGDEPPPPLPHALKQITMAKLARANKIWLFLVGIWVLPLFLYMKWISYLA